MRWVFPAEQAGQADVLSRELSLHPIVGRILVARGHTTPEAANEFLRDGLADLPDPYRMKGMDLAVRRLVQALVNGEKITLYGDYDVDGVTSTATLATFLRAVGGNVATYIPHRIGEGYGLNLDAVERIARDGTSLLVTLDCGISAVDEIARAFDMKLDVVVVDHHQVGPVLPKALAILNPHQ
ncbi:MAG: DHH family phosphoesterase, partial [Myxococcales bacterium]